MSNLIRMDLYRMRKARSFKVCLILAFITGFCMIPSAKAFTMLLKMIPDSASMPPLLPESVTLSSVLSDAFPLANVLLIMFSACYFFYADIEHGYIKNIAGQMPKKGYVVLSRFIALAVHNLLFIAVGIIGNLIGTVLFVKVTADGDILKTLGYLVLRFLLLQGICAVLLLVTTSLRSKVFGIIVAFVVGTGVMRLIYMSIDMGLGMLLKKTISIEKYMPDELLGQTAPAVIPALPVALVMLAVFLFLAVRVFDRRDVK